MLLIFHLYRLVLGVFEFLDLVLQPGKRLKTVKSVCTSAGWQCTEELKNQVLKSQEIVSGNYIFTFFISILLIGWIYATFTHHLLPVLWKMQSAQLANIGKMQSESIQLRDKLEKIELAFETIMPDMLSPAQVVAISEIDEMLSRIAPPNDGQKAAVDMLTSSIHDLSTKLVDRNTTQQLQLT